MVTIILLGNGGGSHAADPITIHVAAPLSGPQENFGKQVRAGVDAALADHKAEVERNGVTVVFEDDGCDKDRAVKIANDLVAAHAQLVLGHVCSVSSIPASAIYAANRVLMLSAASSNALLTERGLPFVFRDSGRDDVQAVAAARLMATTFRTGTFVVIYEDDITGKGHSTQFMKRVSALGRQPSAVYALRDAADIPAIVADATFREAAVVYYAGHQPAELGALLKQARETNVAAQFISNDGANNRAVWTASDGRAEGLLFTFDPDYAHAPAAAQAVATLKATGADAGGFTLPAYAAAEILIDVAGALRDRADLDMNRYLHEQTFETAIGPVSFDAKGDFAQFHSVVYRWSNGEVVLTPY
jgi:branched-chain amino acid transport system substrate-binding protein